MNVVMWLTLYIRGLKTCSMISVESKLDDGVSILNQVVQHQLHSQSLLVPVRKRVKRKTEATNKLKPEHTLRPMTSSTSSSLSSQFSEECTPIQPPRGSTVMTNSGNGVFNNVGGAQYNSGTNFGTTKTFRPRVNPKVSTDSPIKVGAMRTGKGTGVGSGPGLEARFGRDRSARYGGRQVATSPQPCTDDYCERSFMIRLHYFLSRRHRYLWDIPVLAEIEGRARGRTIRRGRS